MAINKISSERPSSSHLVRHQTPGGNHFTAAVARSGDPKALGMNMAAPDPAKKYKAYVVHVKYEDTKGLYKDRKEIWAGSQTSEVIRHFGKGEKNNNNWGQGTGAGLTRTGPNTFEGDLTIILEGVPGKEREDVKNVGFAFADDARLAKPKYDGSSLDPTRIPMHLTGPQ